MRKFLEDAILPELIKYDNKDELEANIILLRKTLHDTFRLRIRGTESLDRIMGEDDFKAVSDFVREKSGCKQYAENRTSLYLKYRPDLKFSEDDFSIRILCQEPIVTLFETETDDIRKSGYHINMEFSKPEIALTEASKYEMVGLFGHEYTHYTQSLSVDDLPRLIDSIDKDERIHIRGISKTLSEGQALAMEKCVAEMYAVKEKDVGYYEYILNDILSSMTKVYNELNCKNKSQALENSFVFRNDAQQISEGDIGISYFILNNLEPKNYYDEFVDRFVKCTTLPNHNNH